LNRGALFIVIVVMCSMFGQFATELYLPSMPAMAKYFNTQMSTIQYTITTYTFGVAIGSFFSGYISDKLGRLKVVFPGLLISIVGSIICCIAFSPEMLLIGRFIQGIGLGGVSVVSRSIVRDISTTRTEFAKFASILGSVSAMAIAFAPIIGGYIEEYLFWRVNFIFLFLFAVILAWLCRNKLVETNNFLGEVEFMPMVREYIAVFKNKQFLLYNLSSSLILAGFIAYQTVSSFLLQVQVGLAPDKFGYTSLFITISLLLGAVINGKLVERKGIEKMIKFGAVIVSIAGILYAVTGYFNYVTTFSILFPMMLFTFAAGIVYPNASSGALSLFVKQAGTAASIYNCFQMLGATLGSWVISSIIHKTQLPLGIMFIFIGMSGIIIYHNIKDTMLHKG
jgi:DHA1 family 2-module integral membrane pump EmrD-like MFS transporter